MNKATIILLFLTILYFFNLKAQESDLSSQTVNKKFVIIFSSKDYDQALKISEEAAKKLDIKLDLRDLTKNGTIGLTWSKEICEGDGGTGYPCYVPRGRYDDGEYISIEYSNYYQGFTKGYYIVIISSGDSERTKEVLNNAKTYYSDAYIKQASVYLGCMH